MQTFWCWHSFIVFYDVINLWFITVLRDKILLSLLAFKLSLRSVGLHRQVSSMSRTADTDKSYGDNFVNVSETKKRLIRVTMKSYDKTGSYVFLKVFKNPDNTEFKLSQQLSLTMAEFDQLMLAGDEIRQFRNKHE